jgi:tetratricopeptide (TPR) repeat protein
MADLKPRIIRALFGLVLAVQLAACATTPPAPTAESERKARSHYSVAMNHLKEGRAGVAITELQAADQIQPNDVWILLALAEAYRLKAHDAEAEKYLKRVLEIRPDFHAAKLNLSAIYIQVGRYDEAIQLSKELLGDATFPIPWKALTNQGYAYFKLGKHAEARTALQNALEYHERFWPAMLDLAILDEDEQKHLEALEGYEQVLSLKPGPIAEAEVHYRIATIYISLGNRSQAMHHLSVASETRPSGVWGKRSADYLKRLR